MNKETGKKVRIENDKRFTTILVGDDSFHWAEGPFSGKSTCEKITILEADKGRTIAEEVAAKALRILEGKLAKGYTVKVGADVLDELRATVEAAKNRKEKKALDPAKAAEKRAKLMEKVAKAKDDADEAAKKLDEKRAKLAALTVELEEFNTEHPATLDEAVAEAETADANA